MLLPVRFFSIYKAADLGCLQITNGRNKTNKSPFEKRILLSIFFGLVEGKGRQVETHVIRKKKSSGATIYKAELYE